MEPSDTRPGATDAHATDVAAGAGGAEAKQAQTTATADPVLEFAHKATGRKFGSVDEAQKAISNLNSMVGDRTLAETRKKAERGERFDRVVEGYAKAHGLSFEAAQTELDSLAEAKQEARAAQTDDSDVKKELGTVKERLDVADLLTSHPEAKHVLDDLKSLAKAKGVSIQEAYEASTVLQTAAKSMAQSSDKDNGGSTTMSPSRKLQSTQTNQRVAEAKERFEKSRTSDNADALVEAALGGKR